MEIYADVVFFINFFMDFFILFVVGKLSHRVIKIKRLLAAGFFMALTYCLLMFLTALHTYLNIFASVTILALGIFIAFKPEKVKEFLKLIAFSYISSFAIGGIAMFLFYFVNMPDVLGNIAGVTLGNFSLKLLITSTCFFYIILKLSYSWYKRVIIKKQVFYSVKIFLDESDVLFTALLDTGNSLYDPISNSPVIIAEFNAVKNFLPDKIKLIYYENNEDDLTKLLGNITESSGFAGRIRMIPFASIGKKNGLIIGFRPDKIEITLNENTVTENNVIVGIYNCILAKDGSYQGLLHPELIKKAS